MLNLPNLLTIFRILLVPVLVAVLLTELEDKEIIGLLVFLVAAATDFLDGFLARRRGEITQLGKLLDPAADKLLTSSAFISLVELGLAPAWMVVVIVGREFAVSALRSLAALEGIAIAAKWSGKIKTTLQIAAISVLILGERAGEVGVVGPWLLWAALLATLYSGVDYFFSFSRALLTQDGGKRLS